MKKFTLLTSFFILLFTGVFAQQVPQGMQYQAVARDLLGKVLSNQEINLRISLMNDASAPTVFYTEVHKATTNSLGLFTLVIGDGKAEKGNFANVPWSTQNIWMQVAIKDKGKSDFTTISSSRLLAVPYAFHAATASQIAAGAAGLNARVDAGVPSQNWSLFGNSRSDASKDKLGTTDFVDLVIVTNNLERLRIKADGNILIKRSLAVGANLTVDSSVQLNRNGGSTINYGPFTVERGSPTLLSGSLTVAADKPTLLGGTLTVDKEAQLNSSLTVNGITNLNSNLNVNNGSPTTLTGSLQVDGITNLNSQLNVNNGSPTSLTGTLLVNKDATFKEKVRIDNATHNSTATDNGALVVSGGVGIGRNLNVGGDAAFGGEASFGGQVKITDATESVSTTTGALVVGGGVGIGKRLNVGGDGLFEKKLGVTGATTLSSTLDVTGASKLNNTLTVTGATRVENTLNVTGATTLGSTVDVSGVASLTNTTDATSSTTGALKVSGGAGIAKNLHVGGTLTANGATTINNGSLSVTGSGPQAYGNHIARFINYESGNGISIQVGNTTPNNNNNFITFLNSSGGTVGRVEGETVPDLQNNPEYKNALAALDYDVAIATVDVTIAGFEIAQAGVEVASAATSTTACAGLGACVSAPIASWIVSAGTNLALKIANEVVAISNLAKATAVRVEFVNTKQSQIGVTYQSGAGDYAEWLPKLNASQRYLPGQIVAVKDGRITLNTDGATQLLVISSKPIVLGNMPPEGEEKAYEKVAFMGQVPVHVIGKVEKGDYILPSGQNNGLGIAVNPANMKPEDYKKIVGVAWTASGNNSYNQINVAIGLNTNAISKVVVEQNEKLKAQDMEISAMKQQMSETNLLLARLVPGFGEAKGINAIADIKETKRPRELARVETAHNDHIVKAPALTPPSDIVYLDVTNDQLNAMLETAEKVFTDGGGKWETHPFWSKMRNDLSFRENVKRQMAARFTKAAHVHREVNLHNFRH